MPTRRPELIISVIGTQFYQPIADLTAKLVARQYIAPDRVGSNYYEGAYSVAIILLLAASVESLIQRDRYFLRTAKPATKTSRASDYAKTVLRYRRHRHLEELFEVRNSIAHNHLWEVEFAIPSRGGRQHRNTQVVSGTHRLREAPPSTTRIPRTKRLGLNLQPGRLDRTDVAKAFGACLHFLTHLSKRGQRPIALTTETVGFKGKWVPFSSLLPEVKNAL